MTGLLWGYVIGRGHAAAQKETKMRGDYNAAVEICEAIGKLALAIETAGAEAVRHNREMERLLTEGAAAQERQSVEIIRASAGVDYPRIHLARIPPCKGSTDEPIVGPIGFGRTPRSLCCDECCKVFR